jgi:hypothetical protein
VRRLLAVVAGLLVALIGTVAAAAWLSSGSGSAAASATSVGRANAPTAVRGTGVVLLSWSASTMTDGSAVGGYQVVRHSGSTSTVVCTVTSVGCTDTSPLAGAVDYGVIATVGTQWRGPESDTTPFAYDDQAPVTSASVSPLPNAANWNNGAVTVTLSATDGGISSGVDHITYSVDGGSPVSIAGASTAFALSATGTHLVSYFAVDGAGNAETGHVLTAKIDPSAPITTATPTPAPNAAGWNNSDVSLAFNATDVDASGVKSVTVDAVTTVGATASKTVTPEGTTTVSYFATDVADNVEGTKFVTVKIDRTAPTAAIDPVSSSSWATGNSIAITASDALSGIASVEYRVDGGSIQAYTGSPFVLPDGSHTVEYRATDRAGNVQPFQSATIKVDTMTPTSSIASTTSTTWTVTASDAAPSSGPSIEYWVDSSAHTTVAGTTAVVTVATGSHTIHWFAKDAAGNQQSQQNLAVTVAPSDSIAPVISNVQPGNATGAWSSIDCSTAAGKICATVTDNVGVISVTMTLQKANGRYWDGLAGSSLPGTTAVDVPMSLSSGVWAPANTLTRANNNGTGSFNDSQYTLTITASDAAGNTTTVTGSFTVSGA